MVKKNILGTIGGTPMVRINRLCPNPNVNIYAKLEGFNPTAVSYTHLRAHET